MIAKTLLYIRVSCHQTNHNKPSSTTLKSAASSGLPHKSCLPFEVQIRGLERVERYFEVITGLSKRIKGLKDRDHHVTMGLHGTTLGLGFTEKT